MEEAFIREAESVMPVPCPCGQARRIITAADESPVSFHVVTIKKDSAIHYHKEHTEIYYVLKGTGEIYLDGKVTPISQGETIYIPPGVRHVARGDLVIVNVVYPPFDSADEFM